MTTFIVDSFQTTVKNELTPYWAYHVHRKNMIAFNECKPIPYPEAWPYALNIDEGDDLTFNHILNNVISEFRKENTSKISKIVALSVKQPWASLIADGIKTIETRTWTTKYRGELLIVSSKAPDIAPAGFALATARLIDCRPMTVDDEQAACCKLYARAKAWILTDIKQIEPFPVKGKLNLYEIDWMD